ncbi:DALR anticodon-binding domain-containing protein, partial [Bacillus altitudinis]|uniref:DALR anticodon-binding domain-containing protein n=1 Tax=Bacillus altitudinis TaxID=293387 RepID=UPI003B5194A1
QYPHPTISTILPQRQEKRYHPNLQKPHFSHIHSHKQYHLLKIIRSFPDLLPQPPQKPIPHPLTNYIYHLPSPLHTFYNPHKLI